MIAINKYIGLLLVTCSCASGVETQEKPVDKVKIDLSASQKFKLDTVLTYNKEQVLNGYTQELKDSLDHNKIPSFFMDECLDVSTMGYCLVNSHETISLREDIIRSLQKEEVKKILTFADLKKLKLKCKTDFNKELKNSDKSTYELLLQVYK